MEKYKIIIIEYNGNELHNPTEHNLLNKLHFLITQSKLFISKNHTGIDIPSIYIYENELKVVAKFANIEKTFS
jgi:hypothetical protein